MASKHTKDCFLQPNRTCFKFKQLLSNVSLTKFPRNRVICLNVKKSYYYLRDWEPFACLGTKQNKIQSLQPLGSFYRLDLTNWWYNQLRLLFAIGLWSVLLPWRGDCHSEETLSKRIVTRERCFVFSSRHERGTKKKMLSTHEESNLRPSDSALWCIVIVTVKIINYFLVVILNTRKIIFYIFHEHWVRISSLETDRILYFFIH